MKCAVIIYDNLTAPCAEIRDNLHNLTEFQLFANSTYSLYDSLEITDTLKMIDEDYDWAVVIGVGNYFTSDIILKTVQHAIDNNSPLACQIFNKDGCYYFEPQYFALNLKEYKKIGEPNLEFKDEKYSFETLEIERSTDNFHEDYTPHWIKPASQNIVKYDLNQLQFGSLLIAEFIKQGHFITNIPLEIRKQKYYAYPNHNYFEIKKFINDKKYKPFTRSVQFFTNEIKKQIEDNQITFTPICKENYCNFISDEKLDCYVGICSGFKAAMLTSTENFSNDCEVILFENSNAAIDWQTFLLKAWDGNLEKLSKIVNLFKQRYPNYKNLESIDNFQNDIDALLKNNVMTSEEFIKNWQQYRKLSHKFVNLDVLDPDVAEEILKIIEDRTAYVYIGNSFYKDYLIFFETQQHIRNRTDKFKETFSNTNNLIVLDIEDRIFKFY